MGSRKAPIIFAKSLRKGMLAGFLALSIFLPASPVAAQGSESTSYLTPEFLRSRISGLEESTEIDDTDRTSLIRLYRQTISNLEQILLNQQAAEGYREAGELARPAIEMILASMAPAGTEDPVGDVHISESMPSAELHRALQEELAQLGTVEATLAAVEARLGAETSRPARVRERIAKARSLISDIASQSDQRVASDENPLLVEARRWASETQLQALQAEIAMLDQEMFSHEVRVELLRAQRDQAVQRVAQIGANIASLQAAINERRTRTTDLAESEAQAVLEGDSGHVPAVRSLARKNVALVERMRKQTEALDTLSDQEARFRPLVVKLAEAARGARKKLNLAGSDAPAGLAIRLQRQQLPSARSYGRERREVHRKITSISLFRLESEEERWLLEDVDAYIENRLDPADSLGTEALAELKQMAVTRRTLIDLALESARTQQKRLYGLDDTLKQLKERTELYDEFLAERLLWVRSQQAIDVVALTELPGEIADYFAPKAWRDAAVKTAGRIIKAPLLSLGILVAAALFWLRNRFRSALAASGENVGRIETDTMSSTFAALLYTLLLMLPIPLVLATLGQALISAPKITMFSTGLAIGLTRTAGFLLVILSARVVMEPKGVAETHFDMNHDLLVRLRRPFGRLIGFSVPLYFIIVSVSTMNPANTGGTLGLLGFVGTTSVLAVFALRVGRAVGGFRGGARRVLTVSLALGIPLTISILALVGYTHTAVELLRRILLSVALLLVVWLARAIVLRWLFMTSRRLDEDQVLAQGSPVRVPQEDGDSDKDGPETPDGEIDDPEVDLVALDTDSRKLLSAATVFLAVLGLMGIWGDVIPALGILDNFRLWNTIEVVNGVEHRVPVTLESLLLAIVIGVGGAITARNLPSLLNIVLIKYTRVTTGGRYASQTLLRYTLVAMTVLLTLSTLGASWSQMGWAAAALGLGIGFGVQEIVANFICGLILLFERPVRVGDVITMGDASGTVTKIRIRATTLRDWDQKELVVPNKELITGRLLNWTLSDPVIRLILKVGVAYGSDVERALKLMLEAAGECELVLDEPNPTVNFEQFGDSSLDLSLRTFVGSFSDRLPATTALHGAIDRKFREAGIVIAFPQRDVHLFQAEVGSSQTVGEHPPEEPEKP
jgi:potassium efflux system protein